ncbi:glycosyltransferase 87 family protein [Geomesophilobacter sediminis]|uniref:DUF2029 domain-containing protein n=1 Tax=Geomesophilobacter sediminis TaxID=2798584 RepID=A0A8J7M235_9BACT|nr:glycosyltransferase 87 family protein [Geomesophilobacter sediminis]MBJ6727295.1 DUF2029 domain-containing protein [Geomesophilobacter sediminis]
MTVSREHLYRVLLIAVAVLIAYGNILNHQFVWDDTWIIVDNPRLTHLADLPSLFFTEDKIAGSTGYYRPITYVSFLLDRVLWGGSPIGFNLTNLLLQLAAAVLFYLVVLELFKKPRYALVAALIFALNPIANETVNFHSGGRNTLLCAVFTLATVWLHARRKPVGAAVCFALAILCKEFGLLVPVLLFLYDRLIAREKVRWTYYLAYAGAIVGYFVLRSSVVQSANFLKLASFSNLVLLTPRLLVRYLENMLWPLRLQTMYEIPAPVFDGTTALCLAGLVVFAGAALWFRKRPEIVFGITCFFLFMAPVSGVLPLGVTMMADRYAYFSAMGIALVVAYLIDLAQPKVVIAVTAALCLWFGATDLQRNGYWRDEFALFNKMIEDVPQRAVGYWNLGLSYYNRDDFDNAARYFNKACFGTNENNIELIWLGELFWEMRKYDDAIRVTRMRMEQEPQNPHPYLMLSRIYGDMGDRGQEAAFRQQALALFAGTEQVTAERASDEWRKAKQLEAEGSRFSAKYTYQKALGIEPNYVPALVSLGALDQELGNHVSAERFLSRALQLAPNDVEAQRCLAKVREGGVGGPGAGGGGKGR